MKTKGIINIFVILLIPVLLICCQNREKTNKNFKNTKYEEKTVKSEDSTTYNTDTLSRSESTELFKQKTDISVCSYVVDRISQIEYKLNGKVKKIELYSYSEFINQDGKKVPDMDSEWYHFQVNYKPCGEYDWDDMGRHSGGAYYYTYKKDSLNRPSIKHMVFIGMDTTKIICSYDDINKTKTETYISSYDNSVFNHYYYFYDEFDNLTMLKSVDDRREIFFKEEWKYDENNNIVYYGRYNYENNELNSISQEYYHYVFDDHNNWIMRYNYGQDNELNSITVRKITYY